MIFTLYCTVLYATAAKAVYAQNCTLSVQGGRVPRPKVTARAVPGRRPGGVTRGMVVWSGDVRITSRPRYPR